jgi:hypothetical protein
MGFPIIPNSVFGRNQKDEPDIFSALPLSVMGSMPSSYRPNEIFHQSPALKRTDGYSYSSVYGDEEDDTYVELTDEERKQAKRQRCDGIVTNFTDDCEEPKAEQQEPQQSAQQPPSSLQPQGNKCKIPGYYIRNGKVFDSKGREVSDPRIVKQCLGK